MSVRTRLIVAFLVLSVLPLTAVTLYSYGSSVGAFRAAVASESDRMAMELQQRLDTVTADLGRQVGRVWEPGRRGAADEARTEKSDGVPGDVEVVERIASMLGDSAKLLDRVEFTPAPGVPAHASSASRFASGATSLHPLRRTGAAPPPPVPPRVVIDMHQVMAQVEKEVARRGASARGRGTSPCTRRAVRSRAAAGRAPDRRLGGPVSRVGHVAAGPGARP